MSLTRLLAVIVLVLAGVAAGLYVGVWLFFVGGIVDIVNAAQQEPVSGKGIAWGLIEVFFLAGFAGWATFGLFSLVASIVAGDDK